MTVLTDLAEYLEEITGQAPEFVDPAPGDVTRVPLFLRSMYRLLEAAFAGRRFVLALAKEAGNGGVTPAQYAMHAELLRAALARDMVLVLPHVTTHVRNRLVRRGVPFIVSGRQMFLPFMAVDLRERNPRPFLGQRKGLTAAAQAVFLGHLIGKPVRDRPIGEIAAMFGYSAMTLTKVAGELEANGLCEAAREGKIRRLRFVLAGQRLWEQGLPILCSPVRRRLWVRRWDHGQAPRVAAGLTALERYTSIADDRVPTFALWRNEIRTALDRGDIAGCEGPDEAVASIECWTYDPLRLAAGDCVDRLSLFLSLRDTHDERIQKELPELPRGVV